MIGSISIVTVTIGKIKVLTFNLILTGARCSSVVRAFVHGAMDRRINPSSWILNLYLLFMIGSINIITDTIGKIKVLTFNLILMGERFSSVVRAFAYGVMGHRIDPL